MNKILLVGELNPYGADPAYALYPLPARASGEHLRIILGLTLRQYLKDHDRANLCTGEFRPDAAAAEAERLFALPYIGYVLCGRKVCDAFGHMFEPFSVYTAHQKVVAILPHPSGRNRMWNDPSNEAKAREAYQMLVRRVEGWAAEVP